ncbi:MAG: hypothetical protein JXQ73_27820 [Phycisphaerae bacterium]|nr:hypothetical protein [Phycisphaerae bacterium]
MTGVGPLDRDTPPDHAAKRQRWARRISIFVTTVTVVPPLVWYGYGRYMSKSLQRQIDAYKAAGQPILPGDFDQPPVPDERNGALAMQRAAELLRPNMRETNELARAFIVSPETIGQRREEAAGLMEIIAEPLAMVRKARGLPESDWGLRFRSPVISIPPDVADVRALGRALAVAALWHHYKADDGEALACVGDLLALAGHVDGHSSLIFHLVSISFSALGTQSIEDISFDLRVSENEPAAGAAARAATRTQVTGLIVALLEEGAAREGLIRALYSERMLLLDAVTCIINGNTDLDFAGDGSKRPLGLQDKRAIRLARPVFRWDALRMLRFATGWVEAAGEGTWPALKAMTPPAGEVTSSFGILTRCVGASLLWQYDRICLLHFRGLALRRMAATALAIRLYELDHGHRPKVLEALVPKYLPAVPDDPFAADGRKIGYRPDATPPVIYSINSDGVDDGGAFAIHEKGHLDQDAKDLPFFLNGDRPRVQEPTSRPGPTTTSRKADERPPK